MNRHAYFECHFIFNLINFKKINYIYSSYYLPEKHYRLKVIGEIYSFNTGQFESSHLFIYLFLISRVHMLLDMH